MKTEIDTKQTRLNVRYRSQQNGDGGAVNVP